MYFEVQIVVVFKSNQILHQNLLHIWPESSSVITINLVLKL